MATSTRLGQTIEINHGGGGKRMDALINFILDKIDQKTNKNEITSFDGDDAAVVVPPHALERIVVSTDSHTVDPLFYRGGNLGDLSVVGTVNDVTVMGARPLYLTLGVIIEEGYLIEDLGKICETIGQRARETGISIITGDTKVMPKGSLSGLVTNTAGIGMLVRDEPLTNGNARTDDVIIVTGTIGDHGAALMSLREGISFDTDLESDVAPFWPYFQDIISHPGVHCMKDLTRGGLASAVHDIATKSKKLIEIEESLVPIRQEAQAICDMLGLEIMEISSEGKAIIVCESDIADEILQALHQHNISRKAKVIGVVKAQPQKQVHIISEIGGTRLLDKPYGEPIPRVC